MKNHDLCILDNWSKQWLLQFNPNKTKAMFFTLKKKFNLPNLVFQQCHLEHIESHKHLGLIFSSDLTWSVHINNIVSNAYKKNWALKKVKVCSWEKYIIKNVLNFH
jgi:hypothetical protein